MDIIQRGNPNILKSIQQKAKQVSESSGISQSMSVTNPIKPSYPEAGAYVSIQKKNQVPVTESFPEKRLVDRLMESVETLSSTKEYFNAVSSLFTLYAMGKLTEGVIDTISREDLREIKGIIREFKGTIDSY